MPIFKMKTKKQKPLNLVQRSAPPRFALLHITESRTEEKEIDNRFHSADFFLSLYLFVSRTCQRFVLLFIYSLPFCVGMWTGRAFRLPVFTRSTGKSKTH